MEKIIEGGEQEEGSDTFLLSLLPDFLQGKCPSSEDPGCPELEGTHRIMDGSCLASQEFGG